MPPKVAFHSFPPLNDNCLSFVMEEERTQRASTARITFSTTLRRDSSTRFILPALAEPLGKHPLVPITEDAEQSATIANRDNPVADPQPQIAEFDSAHVTQQRHMSPADPAAPGQSWAAGPEPTPSADTQHVDSGSPIASHSWAPGLTSPQFDFTPRSHLYNHEHGTQFNTSTWNSPHDLFGAGVGPVLGQFTMVSPYPSLTQTVPTSNVTLSPTNSPMLPNRFGRQERNGKRRTPVLWNTI